MYHYYATLIQIQVNTRTVGILKRSINAHVRAHSRTSENKLSKTAKPLFIGSIPIAASNLFNNLQAVTNYAATDTRCEAAYRQALLELEADNKIEVSSKDGKNLAES